MREQVAKVAALRRRIREADASVTDWELRDWWNEARYELDKVRLFGDLATAAFFEGAKPKEREAKRAEYARAVFEGEADQFRAELDERRRDDPPLAPFHWELEFPELFEQKPSAGSARGNPPPEKGPGFDAIVGNPPFAGKNSVAAGNIAGYPDWLKQVHADSHGNADLVAHFFRRAFNLVRQQGAYGLIATNTIAQGDTRASGLRWICEHGGEIFSVRRRVKWPGLAAVIVCVLHIGKGAVTDRKQIDGRDIERITAFLFHRGGHDDPVRLKANGGKSFQGSIVLGMGFTFDDTDTEGRRVAAGRDAPAYREGPTESGGDLSVHRGAGSEHQPDARASPVCHQLSRLSVCGGRVSKPAGQVCPKTAGYRPTNSLSR